MAASPYSAQKTARLLAAAATDNATLVKAAQATLKRINGYNAKAAPVYLKLYDKATAPTSSDTPRKTYYLPATAAFNFIVDDYFGTGLGYRMTAAAADADATALVASDVLALNIDYI